MKNKKVKLAPYARVKAILEAEGFTKIKTIGSDTRFHPGTGEQMEKWSHHSMGNRYTEEIYVTKKTEVMSLQVFGLFIAQPQPVYQTFNEFLDDNEGLVRDNG